VPGALTTRGSALADRADQHAHSVARRQQTWLVPLGRAGYAAKGGVYLLVGVLAVQAAFGRGGDITDTEGALLHILQAPSGTLILSLVAVGLWGYAVWCWLAALLDIERKGTRAKAVIERIGFGVTGVIYASLGVTALGLVMGTRSSASGDQAAQDRTAWLMSQPFGPWLVGAVGLVVVGVAIAHLHLGLTAGFRDTLRAGHPERRWLVLIGQTGYAAHAVALALIGGFLLAAAVQSRPDEARGLGGALAALLGQPFGPGLLALLGIGLAAYGAYSLAEARYRRVVVS
jgi:hypothetical protein